MLTSAAGPRPAGLAAVDSLVSETTRGLVSTRLRLDINALFIER